MNKELKFLINIVRNGFILAGLMFVSTLATNTLTMELFKPIILFIMGYVFTELARYYGITPKNKRGQTTLIFNVLKGGNEHG